MITVPSPTLTDSGTLTSGCTIEANLQFSAESLLTTWYRILGSPIAQINRRDESLLFRHQSSSPSTGTPDTSVPRSPGVESRKPSTFGCFRTALATLSVARTSLPSPPAPTITILVSSVINLLCHAKGSLQISS